MSSEYGIDLTAHRLSMSQAARGAIAFKNCLDAGIPIEECLGLARRFPRPPEVIPIIPLTKYVIESQTQEVYTTVASGICVVGFNTLDVIVRLHAASWKNAGDLLRVSVFTDAYTDMDPAASFIGGDALATVTFTGSPMAPTIGVATIRSTGNTIGAMIAVKVSQKLGTTATPAVVTISGDLVCRP